MANQWQRIRQNLSSEMQLQESVAAIGTMTITKTPVLDGYLRASWNFAVGAPNKELQGKSRDAVSALNAEVRSFKVGEVGYFVNAQPYANRIEYLGWSQQAPQGMMRISIADWQKINDKIARKNR